MLQEAALEKAKRQKKKKKKKIKILEQHQDFLEEIWQSLAS